MEEKTFRTSSEEFGTQRPDRMNVKLNENERQYWSDYYDMEEFCPWAVKRKAILVALMVFSIEEIECISKAVKDSDEEISFSEFLYRLTDGEIDENKIDAKGRKLIQQIRSRIFYSYVPCMEKQGFNISEDMKVDVLKVPWDLIDPWARKLAKLRDIVYSSKTDYDDEFPNDLFEVISDLEEYYKKYK